MRHGKKVNHLGRQKGHRRALLANLSSALIEHKRIQTTLAKAKALRLYLEPLITKSKDNTTHSRRTVFSYLQDKKAVQELFDNIAGKIADRPGGYLRIIRIGSRLGDAAEMALIEFVDYNDTYVVEKKSKAGAKKKRTRRGKSKTKSEGTAPVETPVAEAPVADAVVEEVGAAVAEVEEVVEETVAANEEVVAEAEDKVEESDEEKTDETTA